MPDITFHALRHTHASQLIDAGVDVVTISRRLGHSGPNITLKVCAHLFRDSDDKAAQAFNEALAKLGYSVNKSAVFALANGSNWVAIPYFVQSPFFQENAQTIDITIKEGWPSGLRHGS
jgi:hypothetical protein